MRRLPGFAPHLMKYVPLPCIFIFPVMHTLISVGRVSITRNISRILFAIFGFLKYHMALQTIKCAYCVYMSRLNGQVQPGLLFDPVFLFNKTEPSSQTNF